MRRQPRTDPNRVRPRLRPRRRRSAPVFARIEESTARSQACRRRTPRGRDVHRCRWGIATSGSPPCSQKMGAPPAMPHTRAPRSRPSDVATTRSHSTLISSLITIARAGSGRRRSGRRDGPVGDQRAACPPRQLGCGSRTTQRVSVATEYCTWWARATARHDARDRPGVTGPGGLPRPACHRAADPAPDLWSADRPPRHLPHGCPHREGCWDPAAHQSTLAAPRRDHQRPRCRRRPPRRPDPRPPRRPTHHPALRPCPRQPRPTRRPLPPAQRASIPPRLPASIAT